MAGVVPTPGQASKVTIGGTAVQVAPANILGGVITNPFSATEELYVNPIDAATTEAVGNTFALQAGQSWTMIPGQTSPTTVNAASNDHNFSVYYTVPA